MNLNASSIVTQIVNNQEINGHDIDKNESTIVKINASCTK